MQKEIYNLTVEPITCVHVGTGNTLTPLNYDVTETKQGNDVFVKYSWDKLLSRMEGDQKMTTAFMRASDASDSGNMKELHKFFKENWKPSELEYICQATNEFLRKYNEKKNGDPLDNAMEVHEMYRTAGERPAPVIPGSSIKGAVRTGLLNSLLSKVSDADYNSYLEKFKEAKGQRRDARFDADLQHSLLGNYKDAKTDPFRALEISDCAFSGAGTQLVGTVKNIFCGADELQSNSIQIIAEVLKGSMLNSNAKGSCRLRINGDLQKNRSVTKAISAQEIRKSCNYFFKREFNEEYKNFYDGFEDDKTAFIEKLKQQIEEIAKSEDSFILRVGRWSQVEFVTYETNFRNPKTPTRRGKTMSYGGTRFVFDNDGKYLPLGWCKCTLKKAEEASGQK